MAQDVLSRLGVYVLPGRVPDPRPALGQARVAEHLGLGSVWIGERYGTKDVSALAGAISQTAPSIAIGTAISHFLVRHPVVLASTAMTLQALTEGKFTFGFGRSAGGIWSALGLPEMRNDVLVDSVDIFKRLCRGEKVSYDGPAGSFPRMRLGDLPDVAPPKALLAAIGPKSLAIAGAHFDGAILHPFLTSGGVAASVERVRNAAADAGRNAEEVVVRATVVIAPDLPPDEEVAVVGGRAVTYFQIPGFGETLASVNGWDLDALEVLRSHPLMKDLRGSADAVFTRAELSEVSETLPAEWLTSGAAVGGAAECARRLREYLEAGADELILHGSTADLLGATIAHLRV
jgi:probable F420-dependent oxidoreductase